MVYNLDIYVEEFTNGFPILDATVTINNIDKQTDVNGYTQFIGLPEELLNVYANKTGYNQFWFQFNVDEQHKISSIRAPLERNSCTTVNCNFAIE